MAGRTLDFTTTDRARLGDERVDQLTGSRGRIEPITRKAEKEPTTGRRRECGAKFFGGITEIEEVHGRRERDIAIRIKAFDESASLVREIRTHRKGALETRIDRPRLKPRRVELGPHGFI